MQWCPDLSGTRHLQLVGNFLSLALAGQGFWKKYYPPQADGDFFQNPKGLALRGVGRWALTWPKWFKWRFSMGWSVIVNE